MSDDGKLTVGSLFAGIGGIDLGLERTGGFRTEWFSEIDPYASRVLAHHWPQVPNLGDVRNLGAHNAPWVDVLAGGFPCQPVSLAGERKGKEDERWLWPEFSRLARALQPRIVLVENVPGLASKGLRDVVADLSALGYDTEWDVVSASAVGAPHLRERIFLVAYAAGWGRIEGPRALGEHARRLQPSHQSRGARRTWAVEPGMGRVAYGVPNRVDRLRALGNGVVPQAAEFVGRLILNAVREGRL